MFLRSPRNKRKDKREVTQSSKSKSLDTIILNSDVKKSSPQEDITLLEEGTPLRVTRSRSKSEAGSALKSSENSSKKTERRTVKPPLFLKDPFSPQITEAQRKKLIKQKEADKAKPRKKYYNVKKVKSKRI